MPDDDVLTRAKSARDNWRRLRRTQLASYPDKELDDLIALAETQAARIDETRRFCERADYTDDLLRPEDVLATLDGLVDDPFRKHP